MAPPRKERGRTCGAYRAGVLLISILTTPKSHGKKRSKKRVQRAEEKEKLNQKAAEVEAEFRKLFITEFGVLDCAEIKRKRETGWSGMDDVVGITARLLERVLKERP